MYRDINRILSARPSTLTPYERNILHEELARMNDKARYERMAENDRREKELQERQALDQQILELQQTAGTKETSPKA